MNKVHSLARFPYCNHTPNSWLDGCDVVGKIIESTARVTFRRSGPVAEGKLFDKDVLLSPNLETIRDS